MFTIYLIYIKKNAKYLFYFIIRSDIISFNYGYYFYFYKIRNKT